jgi:hypothetical protein
MMVETPVREGQTHLGARESDIAGRAVFAWVLVPAAGRMLHDLAEGHAGHEAVDELRAAVRLLDRLGWPDDESDATRLTNDEAAVVNVAARSQLGRGLNPDRAAQARVARGHAIDQPRSVALTAVLDALERRRA